MALQKQNVAISLGTGIDTKTDPKQVIPGKLLYLKNAVLNKLKKLIKRPGYEVLTTGMVGNSLATYQNELLRFDGRSLESYSDFDETLYDKGQKIACSLTVQSVVSNSYEQTNADSAIHSGGFRIFAWDDSSGGVRYSVFDDSTGQSIVSSALVSSTASRSKVIAIGSYVLIFFVDTDLKYIAFNSANPTSPGAPVTVASLTQSCYDVSLINGSLIIPYSDGSGQTSLKSLSSALVLSSALQVNVDVSRVSVFGDVSSNLWVAYTAEDSQSVGYFIVASGLLGVILSPTTIESTEEYSNITGYYDTVSSLGVIAYEVTADLPSDHYVYRVNADFAGSISDGRDLLRSVGLFAKPFIYDSRWYTTVAFESELQSTYFIIDDEGRVIAKIAPSSGGGLRDDSLLAEVNFDGPTDIQFAYLIKDYVTSVNGNVTTQTGVNSANIEFETPIMSIGIGDNLISSGAKPTMYDGVSVVEQGFHVYPENLRVTTNAGGGTISPGTRQYKGIYTWTDNEGQIHRSAPSVGVSLDTDENNIYISGAIDGGGSFTPTNPTDYFVYPTGSTLVGSGASANTRFTQNQETYSPFGSPGSGVYQITPGWRYIGSTALGSDVISLGGGLFGESRSLMMDIESGSSTVTIYNGDWVKAGMVIQFESFSTSSNILSVVGNTLTLSSPSGYTANKIYGSVSIGASGSASSASPTITGLVSTDAYTNGQTYFVLGPNTNKVLLSKTTTSLTFTTNIGFNGSVTVFGKPPADIPSVGQSLFLIDSQFSGPVTVESVDISNNTIRVNEKALATETEKYIFTDDTVSSTIEFPTLRITDKTDAALEVYRTEANGSIFYKANTTTIINDTSIDFVEFVDTLSDQELVGNELLYTTGGVVENIAPPAFDSIFTFKNRVCIFPSESSSQEWYSKSVLPGTPIEFSDLFTLNIPERDGGAIGGGQLDDKMVMMKKNLIFITYGDGPNNTGANNDFADPQEIPADCGLIDKNSVVSMPMGLMFKGSKGIYLLDRSLQVKYIGAEVEEFNQYPVTSSKKMESVNQVRFTLDGTDKALVYDYFSNQWSVFENIEATDAVMYMGNYVYLKPDGSIHAETPGEFLDDDTYIPMGFVTSWLSFAGLQAFQRVYTLLILGEYKSPHSLQIQVSYDFEASYTQEVIIPVLDAPPGQYQWEVPFKRQKCEAIQITLSETQDEEEIGEGLNLSSFTLEVGAKQGLNKKGSASTYG